MTWMKKHCWSAIAVTAYLAIASTSMFAQGNEDLVKMSQDNNQWVMPLGDYSGTRHSSLNQINAQNAWKLKVAWTMSTGALRGHEATSCRWQDDVFPERLSQLCLRHRPRQLLAHRVEIHSAAGQARAIGGML